MEETKMPEEVTMTKGNNSGIEGAYSGTFTVTYFKEMPQSWVGSGSGQTTLELKDGKYTCAGNPDRVPAGGSGNYTVSENIIVFEETSPWSCDFDPGLILEGVYSYTFNGKELKLSKVYEGYASYEYVFVKE